MKDLRKKIEQIGTYTNLAPHVQLELLQLHFFKKSLGTSSSAIQRTYETFSRMHTMKKVVQKHVTGDIMFRESVQHAMGEAFFGNLVSVTSCAKDFMD
eukprot:4670889-Pleurochrysis_carterae.AAC.1